MSYIFHRNVFTVQTVILNSTLKKMITDFYRCSTLPQREILLYLNNTNKNFNVLHVVTKYNNSICSYLFITNMYSICIVIFCIQGPQYILSIYYRVFVL